MAEIDHKMGHVDLSCLYIYVILKLAILAGPNDTSVQISPLSIFPSVGCFTSVHCKKMFTRQPVILLIGHTPFTLLICLQLYVTHIPYCLSILTTSLLSSHARSIPPRPREALTNRLAISSAGLRTSRTLVNHIRLIDDIGVAPCYAEVSTIPFRSPNAGTYQIAHHYQWWQGQRDPQCPHIRLHWDRSLLLSGGRNRCFGRCRRGCRLLRGRLGFHIGRLRKTFSGMFERILGSGVER